MANRIPFFLLALFFLMLPLRQAHAVDVGSCTGSLGGLIQTSCNSCVTLINTNLTATPSAQVGLVAPLVQCFTALPTDSTSYASASNLGIIPAVVYSFLTTSIVQTYYSNIVRAMATLLVVIFGISIITGNAPDFKKEGFTLLFKVAGVFYFLSAAPTIYTELLSAVQGIADALSQAAYHIVSTSGSSNSLCINVTTAVASATGSANVPGLALWNSWDCIVGYMFGFTDDAAAKTAGIATFLLYMFFTKSTGSLLISVAIYVMSTLLFAAARFVHLYLMAVLGFSFLFMFGYMFVPLLLFKQTFPYFQKWLYTTLGFLLSPVILLGYMGMMLVAIDYTIFSGPYSIAYVLTGGPATSGSNIFSNIVNNPGNVANCVHTLLFTVHNNNPNDAGSGAATPGCDGITPNTTSSATAGTSFNNGTLSSSVRVGTGTGSQLESSQQVTNENVFFTANGINLTALASTANQPNPGIFLSNLLVSFISSGLLLYVMYALLEYIPDLAKDLVGSDSRAVSMQRQQAFSESMMRGAHPGPGQGLSGGAAGGLDGFVRGSGPSGGGG